MIVCHLQKPTHPLFNVGIDAVQNAHVYFESISSPLSHGKVGEDDLNTIDNDSVVH